MQHPVAIRAHRNEVVYCCIANASVFPEGNNMMGFCKIDAQVPVGARKIESAYLANIVILLLSQCRHATFSFPPHMAANVLPVFYSHINIGVGLSAFRPGPDGMDYG